MVEIIGKRYRVEVLLWNAHGGEHNPAKWILRLHMLGEFLLKPLNSMESEKIIETIKGCLKFVINIIFLLGAIFIYFVTKVRNFLNIF